MLQTNFPINLKRFQLISLSLLKKYGVNGYISSNTDISKEFFTNVTNLLTKKYKVIPYSYKAESLWFTDGTILDADEPNENRAYFRLSCYNSQYNEKVVATKDLLESNKECLKEIIDELAELAYTIKGEQIKNEKLPPIEEMLQKVLQCFQKKLDTEQFSIQIEKGRLNLEYNIEPYNCLIIRSVKTNDYVCSIVLGRNNLNEYTLTERRPLCGESSIILDINDIENSILRIL